MYQIFCFSNPFVPNAPFLYPLKTSENRNGLIMVQLKDVLKLRYTTVHYLETRKNKRRKVVGSLYIKMIMVLIVNPETYLECFSLER